MGKFKEMVYYLWFIVAILLLAYSKKLFYISGKETVFINGLHVFIVNPSYLFMSKCWDVDPNKRPKFSKLVSSMSQILATLADYMDVFTFGEMEAQSRDLADDTEVTEDKL